MLLGRKHRSLGDIGRDVRWGVVWVTPFVVVFGGMSLAGELLGVKFAGFNIERTIFVYVVFGLLTGVVLGILRPIASSIWGAGVIGAIVGIPIAFYISIIAGGWGSWGPGEIVFFSITIAICAGCAVAFRRGYARAEERSRTKGPL